VLGILGLTCILPIIGPILALVFGIVALNQISKSHGAVTGNGQAIAGLVLGGVGLVMLPIMAAMFLPALSSAREKARDVNCMSNVKQIGLACAMYADQHDGRLPRGFDDLKDVIPTTKVFVCPSAKDPTHYSYEFMGVTNKWQDDPDVVILRETEANHRGRRTLLYNDGHVESKRDTR
jgi:prepilin-type processing-associated H-X9-DG protein